MIAIIDCNNFYVSCERLFRPDLAKKPVVVLSNNDGCVISRSQEAKDLGIKMGVPYFMAKDLFKEHNVTVFSSNYTLYGDISARVIECIDRYTDKVEVYSVDEAFALLHGVPSKACREAVELREHILKWVGIPVKIGIAPSKTLAKICAKKAKNTKEGVYMVYEQQAINYLLEQTKIDEVWGIGKGLHKQLAALGISTADEYVNLPSASVRQRWGVVGLRMQKELQGMACHPITTEWQLRQQVLTSRSFASPVTHLESLREAVSHYMQECVDKLRAGNLTTLKIGVFVQMYGLTIPRDYECKKLELQLLAETDDVATLTKQANRLLKALFQPNRKYKKVGVYCSELRLKHLVQYSIFDTEDRAKTNDLATAIDGLRKRFGKNTVQLASCGTEQKWKMKSSYCSKRSTTHKTELVKL